MCFTYITVAGFCYCQFLLQFMDIYNNCFENPVNTSFSIYFHFIFCHNHPSLDSLLSILCQISHCHICIWIPTFEVRVLMVVTVPECESESFVLAKFVSWTFVADTTSEGNFVVSFVTKKVDLAVECLPDLSKLINQIKQWPDWQIPFAKHQYCVHW